MTAIIRPDGPRTWLENWDWSISWRKDLIGRRFGHLSTLSRREEGFARSLANLGRGGSTYRKQSDDDNDE